MEIILRDLDNPNLNKILIALLHDIQEDMPEYADSVRIIYGDYIADGVNALSKKPRENYLTSEELNEC
jgi:(p)ppGpp synthase/HD superfamily hydrolase